MSPRLTRVAARVAQGWVRGYTRGLPAETRSVREAEARSDIFEQEQEALQGRGSVRVASDMLVRTVLGAPSDVRWRFAFGKQARRSRPMDTRSASSLIGGRGGTVRRPRSPGLLSTAVLIALVALVSTFAFTSRQTSPPTIAEFAPQAVEQITEMSGDSMQGTGTSSGDTPRLTDAERADDTARTTIEVARVRQCVGDPPRQIEDPQSPPCVPYWSGDNGGATWRGVTRDEIRVANENEYIPNIHGPMLAFVNRRFEFYGRRIRMIPHNTPRTPVGVRATARAVYEEDQAFASTVCCAYAFDYTKELARLGIVGVTHYPFFDEPYLAELRPFLWQYPMALDRMFATAGNWYCARLAGRNAVHAGDPLLRATRRKAGIIFGDTGVGAFFDNPGAEAPSGQSSAPMSAQLNSCGEQPETQTARFGDGVFAENAILRMRSSGVTTVACLCISIDLWLMLRAATNQGYFPEWLVTTYFWLDASPVIRESAANEQLRSLMGLTMQPMERAYSERPSTWAMTEGAGSQCPATSSVTCDDMYRELLLLAAGLQMAGPRLTPQTFEQGLHRARFPNSPHRIMPGRVGFVEGGGWAGPDHSMTDDAAEMWWSNSELPANPSEGPGTYCYVDHGARRRIGTFPTDDPFFKGDCDNGGVRAAAGDHRV